MNPTKLDQLSIEIYNEIVNSDLIFPVTDKAIDTLLKDIKPEYLNVDFSNEVIAKINGESIEQEEVQEKIISFPVNVEQVAGFYRNKRSLTKQTEDKLKQHRKNITKDLDK